MEVLDDNFDKKRKILRTKWYLFLPYKNWKACWLHTTIVTFLSFCFLLPIYFNYDSHLKCLFFLLIIELGIFWRYLKITQEILNSFLCAIFWISFFIIIVAWLFPIFNSIAPYNWMHISGPYRMEQKTMTHVALEASIIAILYTLWSLLPFTLKQLWEYYRTLGMRHF
jgi:hypothetical protein